MWRLDVVAASFNAGGSLRQIPAGRGRQQTYGRMSIKMKEDGWRMLASEFEAASPSGK